VLARGYWRLALQAGIDGEAIISSDPFIDVSDTLFEKGKQLGARVQTGGLAVGATKEFFPELHELERELAKELDRFTTIRIFPSSSTEMLKASGALFGLGGE
jgi:hypothetical protein